jgi:hypothetical protein
MAERNILLSSSAIFIFFAFNRLLYNIIRYSENEYRLSTINSANPLYDAQKRE